MYLFSCVIGTLVRLGLELQNSIIWSQMCQIVVCFTKLNNKKRYQAVEIQVVPWCQMVLSRRKKNNLTVSIIVLYIHILA